VRGERQQHRRPPKWLTLKYLMERRLEGMERPIGIESTPEPWQGGQSTSQTLEWRHF
jgi:hypothetical protein